MTELSDWLAITGAVAAALGTIGGLAGVTSLLKARAEKRKLAAETEKTAAEADKVDADAAAQLTDVALRLVQPLSTELDTLRQSHASTQARVAQLESDQHTQRMLLVEHSVWDHLALARMQDAGVDLPPIPPLFPPRPNEAGTQVKVEVTTPAEPAT